MVHELILGPLLELFWSLVAQHLLIGVVLVVGLCLQFTAIPLFQRRVCPVITGHHSTFSN